jgi:hypothetical protein
MTSSTGIASRLNWPIVAMSESGLGCVLHLLWSAVETLHRS